jgi:hypothetical protein
MSRKKKTLVGEIGYCENKKLSGMTSIVGGHYVYIRKIDGNKCDVNVITSLEDKNGFTIKKIAHVKKGNTYPIPYRDANFFKWSGVNCNSIKGVNISDIQDIGKKKIKRRHKFFIGKFLK